MLIFSRLVLPYILTLFFVLKYILMQQIIYDFFHNIPLMSALISTIIAQVIKLVINIIVYKKLDLYLIVATGGMPSSHTACVGALWMSIVLIHGLISTECAIASVLAGIVYRDAVGVRRQAGIHASILNNLTMRENDENDPTPQLLKPLKTLLGHTPTQALVGLAEGIVVGLIVTLFVFS